MKARKYRLSRHQITVTTNCSTMPLVKFVRSLPLSSQVINRRYNSRPNTASVTGQSRVFRKITIQSANTARTTAKSRLTRAAALPPGYVPADDPRRGAPVGVPL